MTNVALKEIHIANEKSRDANVRFVSLIKKLILNSPIKVKISRTLDY